VISHVGEHLTVQFHPKTMEHIVITNSSGSNYEY